jgi:hypothetical protein
MELLQKFEEASSSKDQSVEGLGDGGDEDGEEDDLLERLGAVDLGALLENSLRFRSFNRVSRCHISG